MPISGLLFGTTHSVEQITNIKSKKKVDKILLKVVKVIKAKGKLDGWVKPTASLSKDLKLSDKTILSIMKTLGAYYQIDLTAKKLDTPAAIVTEIKVKKPKVVNSLYLVDIDEMEVDVDDDVQTEDVPDDPGMSVPKPEPAPLEEPHVEPAVPDPLPAESETPPNSGAVIGTVEGELQQDPETVQDPEATASTEGLLSSLFGIGKYNADKVVNSGDFQNILKAIRYLGSKKPDFTGPFIYNVIVPPLQECKTLYERSLVWLTSAVQLAQSGKPLSAEEFEKRVQTQAARDKIDKRLRIYGVDKKEVHIKDSGYMNASLLAQVFAMMPKYKQLADQFTALVDKNLDSEKYDILDEYQYGFYGEGNDYPIDVNVITVQQILPKLMRATKTTTDDLRSALGLRGASESLSTEGLLTTAPQASTSWGSFLNNL